MQATLQVAKAQLRAALPNTSTIRSTTLTHPTQPLSALFIGSLLSGLLGAGPAQARMPQNGSAVTDNGCIVLPNGKLSTRATPAESVDPSADGSDAVVLSINPTNPLSLAWHQRSLWHGPRRPWLPDPRGPWWWPVPPEWAPLISNPSPDGAKLGFISTRDTLESPMTKSVLLTLVLAHGVPAPAGSSVVEVAPTDTSETLDSNHGLAYLFPGSWRILIPLMKPYYQKPSWRDHMA